FRLWTWPMKSQVKSSPQAACLAIRASLRFSPTSVTPPSARLGRSSASTYLVAASTSTDCPTSARTRARFSRTTAASSTLPHHPLPAGDPGVPPMREVTAGVADRALAGHFDAGGPSPLERTPGTQPQIGAAVLHDVWAEA